MLNDEGDGLDPTPGYCLGLAVTLVVVAATIVLCIMGCPKRAGAATLPAPLEALLARLKAPGTPQWKRDLVPMIRDRKIGRTEAVVTYYCPGNAVDPLGGGVWGAWGVRLRKGHAAVGTTRRLAPYGSIVYCPGALDHLLIITDCGPGVDRIDRLDVCLPDTNEYLAHDDRNWRRYPCWVLGRVGKEQAR